MPCQGTDILSNAQAKAYATVWSAVLRSRSSAVPRSRAVAYALACAHKEMQKTREPESDRDVPYHCEPRCSVLAPRSSHGVPRTAEIDGLKLHYSLPATAPR